MAKAKNKTHFVCKECGYDTPKWMGKCPDCGEWNSFEEHANKEEQKKGQRPSISTGQRARKITEVDNRVDERYSTGVSEFDRVLGGGIVTDSIVMITAAPGTGKSTLILQTSQNLAEKGKVVLYCSGEESEHQIKSRGHRLFGDNLNSNIYLKATNSMDEILEEVKELNPDMLIVDSIQSVALNEFLPSRAGNGVQVTECVNAIKSITKKETGKRMPTIVIGQLTKGGDFAGVNHLAHEVDAVIYLEGDKNTQLRIMRPDKNRFGSTDEVGMFEMTDKGLRSVDNPNEMFTTQRDVPMVGCALASVAEGTRTFVVEVQSLVTKCIYGMPVRNAIGYSKEYIKILASMLEARTDRGVSDRDISIQVTGGIYVKDVAANLGVIMSIVSSHINSPIPDGCVFIGEVGLTGEITNVQHMALRVKAIDRYGFKRVFVPYGALKEHIDVKNVEIVPVRTLQDVIKAVF